MPLKDLIQPPESVRQTAAVLAGLDLCFLVGFGRLGPEQTQALQALGRICSATPLGGAVGAAIEALARNEFVEKHFAALAAARAALQGAQHDALRKQAAEALGRTVPVISEAPLSGFTVPEAVKVWQESVRHWLMEIAIAGFSQLDGQTLAPFAATLEQLQGEPLTTRLAALLTGFREELLNAMPIAALPSVPVFRWADLWTRAMVGALRTPLPSPGSKVSGSFAPLGVDLRHHGYFVSAVIYGLLDADEPQVARVSLSSYKVDVVRGPEMWQCFDKPHHLLIKGLSQHVSLKVQDATLLPTGDLLWDGKATAGPGFDWTEKAEALAVGANVIAPGATALDRHPIQIAEPAYLEGYQVASGVLDFGDGVQLPLAVERLSNAVDLSIEAVKPGTALVGLLRFDGGRWGVQPLVVGVPGKKNQERSGSGAFEALTPTKKQRTLAILKERSSRLLRKKS
jgi:hypothetical protein